MTTAKISNTLQLLTILCISFTSSSSASSTTDDAFLSCLAAEVPPSLILTPSSSSYETFLTSSIRNLRYALPGTPRPFALVEAAEHSHVQATVRCGRRHGVRVRTRSGGHDYEGVSSASADSHERFALLDIGALRAIHVDTARAEAWAESGATVGELYYAVGTASRTLGFPAGTCPSVGLGGHLSGGGIGMLAREYGLGSDNVLDALVVDADGRLLNRSTMGEDHFWAIRGGGGGSFNIVLSWKLRLVRVPERISVFTINRSRNQSAVDLMTKWQEIASALPSDIVLRVLVENQQARFVAQYLGPCHRLLHLMRTRFPELGMTRQDCEEISWIQSTVYNHVVHYQSIDWRSKPLELLLERTDKPDVYLKAKSDYVLEPMPRHAWESLWAWIEKPEAGPLALDPMEGMMGNISPSATPFPHRKGNLFQIEYYSVWYVNDGPSASKHIRWVRELHNEMEPYVSKNPRAVYVNYRDLDLGTNELEGNVTSYAKGRIWGEKYFKGNFHRLAAVKAMVDPEDFFRHEQSIPPLPATQGRSVI